MFFSSRCTRCPNFKKGALNASLSVLDTSTLKNCIWIVHVYFLIELIHFSLINLECLCCRFANFWLLCVYLSIPLCILTTPCLNHRLLRVVPSAYRLFLVWALHDSQDLTKIMCFFSHVPLITCNMDGLQLVSYEPVREETNNLGFRPGLTQTRLYSHRKELEAWNFGFK